MNSFINNSIKSLRLFLFALILCTLAACGGGNDGASTGPSNVNATTAPTTPETTAPTDAKLSSPVDAQAGAAPIGKMEIGKIYCVTCSSCHVPETMNLSFCPHRTN